MFNRKSVAYIFPGQGSQRVGMGRELYEESPAAKAAFDEADEALGIHLSRLCFFGPEEELRQTVNAQPAILAASVATLRAMAEACDEKSLPAPRFMAGHSLGEYTALVAAGALDYLDALLLVRERGRLMQEADERCRGGMAAILGLNEAGVEKLMRETGVEIANINGDNHLVISGEAEVLARAIDFSAGLGASKAVPLEVSGAFHSRLMKPAVPGMAAALEKATFRPPAVPIVGNCTGEPLHDVAEIRSELLEQLCACVQWSRSVKYMIENGATSFVEIGPGNVLTRLVKRIDQQVQAISVGDPGSVKSFANYQSSLAVDEVAVGSG